MQIQFPDLKYLSQNIYWNANNAAETIVDIARMDRKDSTK